MIREADRRLLIGHIVKSAEVGKIKLGPVYSVRELQTGRFA